jgi:hypothetical protein
MPPTAPKAMAFQLTGVPAASAGSEASAVERTVTSTQEVRYRLR